MCTKARVCTLKYFGLADFIRVSPLEFGWKSQPPVLRHHENTTPPAHPFQPKFNQRCVHCTALVTNPTSLVKDKFT